MNINKNIQIIKSLLSSISIPAEPNLMEKLLGCHQLLDKITEEANQISSENEELKKALEPESEEQADSDASVQEIVIPINEAN